MRRFIRTFIFNQKIEYLFWGVITTLVYFVARILTMLFTSNVFIPVAIAQILSIAFAFVVNQKFVFNDKPKSNSLHTQIIIFIIGRASAMGLDFLLSYLMIKKFATVSIKLLGLSHINYQWILFSSKLTKHLIDTPYLVNTMIWMVLIQVIIIVINYIVSKYFAFK